VAFLATLLSVPSLQAQAGFGFYGGGPPFIDLDGNLAPGTGEAFNVTRGGNTLQLAGGGMPFKYGLNNVVLENPLNGVFTQATNFSQRPFDPFQHATRVHCGIVAPSGGCAQMVSEEYYNIGPISSQEAALPPPVFRTITLTLLDQNNDGCYDAFQLAGTGIPTSILNLVKLTSGGKAFISIPWTLASVIGVSSGTSQVFLPLGPTSKLAFDLDFNGVPDPDLLSSVCLNGNSLAAAIPTLGEWGMIGLGALLLLFGVQLLRRSGGNFSLS
jgi:hypothetical protein